MKKNDHTHWGIWIVLFVFIGVLAYWGWGQENFDGAVLNYAETVRATIFSLEVRIVELEGKLGVVRNLNKNATLDTLWISDTYKAGNQDIELNRIGRSEGFGGCMHCGDTWNWKKPHDTDYEDLSAMFPLCEECFQELDFDVVLDYHLRLFEEWGREPTDEQVARIYEEIAKHK